VVLALVGAFLTSCNAQQTAAQFQARKAEKVRHGAPSVCAAVVSNAPAALQHKPGYQQVALSVMDASGHEVADLKREDLVVEQANVGVPVAFVEYLNTGPVSVLILADSSGSTLAKLPQTRRALTQIVGALDPRDEVALWAFSGKPFNLQDFTQEHSVIIEREKMLHAYGSTSLFDSVFTASERLKRGCYARRVLVVISDGGENTSGKTRDVAKATIESAGISMYAIAIGSSDEPVKPGVAISPLTVGQNRDTDMVDEKSLGLLSIPAGGSTFRISETGDSELLAAAAKSIIENSRGQYVVGFLGAAKADPAPVTVQVKNHDDYVVTMQRPPLSVPAQSPPSPASSP
jgi:VWFA-related protein